MTKDDSENVELTKTDARQGQTRTGSRYVLVASMALAVIAVIVLLKSFG